MLLGTFELLLGICGLLLIIYSYWSLKFNFWKSRNVPGPKPIFFFGTTKDVILRKVSLGHYVSRLYKKYSNEPMFGIYLRNRPILIINDPELIKNVLIKDFKHFMERGLTSNDKIEPLSAHLFLLEAKRWRPMRTKLTPVFTSGKLKEMFHLIAEVAERFDKYLNKFDGKTVDMRDISAKFTTDTIGVCAFGLEAHALDDEDSIFRKMGKRVFTTSWRSYVQFTLMGSMPILYNLVGRLFIDHVLEKFFINLTKETIEYRKENNIKRHDFIDLLTNMKDKNDKIDDIELTDSLLAAQLFVFFVAGFETSSSTMSNCLFELAMNPEIQKKIKLEITEELKKSDGKFTYEMIQNMKYLDKVFKETLRKYPPVMFLSRKTIDPYTIPDTNITLPIGTAVWTPVYGIHHDPKYYPEPEVFDPERFTDEEVEKRPAMSYLPFGDGPRNCIGLRFGQLQTKVGLVKILQNHTVNVCEETDKTYNADLRNNILAPKNGIKLQINKQ
ncbi:probable cytochrome P450 6a14 [Chelonus insularis]|uniref:probable cytochrome P450 6a14 n=1 Tax=Chelonus insularis TaxID=460826 RepID=UPI0015887F6B|nr:probable cytochrome P450 6a14 [Chelonus insularis]